MLDEDPGLLRCAGLTVPDVVCALQELEVRLSYKVRNVVVTRAFNRPEAELDRERADARAMSGEYMYDRNLFYEATADPDGMQSLYDALAQSTIVDTVDYKPKPP